MATEPRPLVVIGAGAVGETLGRLFGSGHALAPVAIVNQSLASAERASRVVGGASIALADVAELRRFAPLATVLLGTGDRSIGAVSDEIARLQLVDASSVVFHCSGALTADVLSACAKEGAATASVHPLTTFGDRDRTAANFAGTFCIVEGDARALAVLEPALFALGARLVTMPAEAKVLYHAGAVFASNFLQAIIAAAIRAENLAGIDQRTAVEMLAPLIRASVENALMHGAPAITGPVQRGDDAIVASHFQALASTDAMLAKCYRDMTAWTASVLHRDDPLEGLS